MNSIFKKYKKMNLEAGDQSGVLRLSAAFADALRLRDAYTRLHSDRAGVERR